MTVAIVLTVAIGLMPLAQHANADYGNKTVMMTITNTKTNNVKMLKWDMSRYQFEENIKVPVDNLKEKKIEQIFNTNKFVFTWQLNEYDATWYHFKVKIAAHTQPTNPMKVTFIQYRDIFTNGVTKPISESNSIKTFVSMDKQVYREGERALLFINFIDSNDKFLNPDSMTASFNFIPVGSVLEKKKLGSYVYVTPPLERGDNWIVVLPYKEGYKTEPEYASFTVITSTNRAIVAESIGSHIATACKGDIRGELCRV